MEVKFSGALKRGHSRFMVDSTLQYPSLCLFSARRVRNHTIESSYLLEDMLRRFIPTRAATGNSVSLMAWVLSLPSILASLLCGIFTHGLRVYVFSEENHNTLTQAYQFGGTWPTVLMN
jgi:hypothetical protein